MRNTMFIFVLILSACTDKNDIVVPGGTSTAPAPNTNSDSINNTNSSSFDCPGEWTEQDGYFIDPVTCLAWTPPVVEIDWYDSVNPAQAQEGGCTENCDKNEDSNYCADLNLGGIDSWKLPSIDELEDLSLRSPPMEDLDIDIWSYNSDAFEGMALTANLFQSGMFFALEKDTLAGARCVTN